MLVWEAHNELALSIGDQVNITAGPPIVVPHGVRYSKSLRDSYLYRAILKIYNDIIQSTLSQITNLVIAHSLIEKTFPNMTEEIGIESDIVPDNVSQYYDRYYINFSDHRVPLLIYSANVFQNVSGIFHYPLPIKYGGKDSVGLTNTKNVQRADPFMMVNGDKYWVHDPSDSLDHPFQVSIRYLPVPYHPKDQDLTASLDIESKHIPLMLSLATMYAMTDSQEISDSQLLMNMQLSSGGQK